ncbi:Uncharacterised protein [Vibrio cholerae]|nr:Uncharacterised protein [Vibrio cholerae]
MIALRLLDSRTAIPSRTAMPMRLINRLIVYDFLISLMLACYKMERLSGGNYTHGHREKVMQDSHFRIRFITRSLISVTPLNF